MSDLQESTAPLMARLALYFLTALILLITILIFRTSLAAGVDNFTEVMAVIFSIVMFFWVVNAILGRRSRLTQKMMASIWMIGGMLLGSKIPTDGLLNQPSYFWIIMAMLFVLIVIFFYMAYVYERRIREESIQQYSKAEELSGGFHDFD